MVVLIFCKSEGFLHVGGLKATATRGIWDEEESSSDSAAGCPWGLDPGFSVFGAGSPLTMPVTFPKALDCHMQDCRGFAQRPRRAAEMGTQVGEVGCLYMQPLGDRPRTRAQL